METIDKIKMLIALDEYLGVNNHVRITKEDKSKIEGEILIIERNVPRNPCYDLSDGQIYDPPLIISRIIVEMNGVQIKILRQDIAGFEPC